MRLAVTALMLTCATAANAACPQQLAVYSDPDKSLTVEFTPNEGEMMTVSNRFRVVMANDVVLDGLVIWGNGVSRPDGLMMVDEFGNVDFLPPEGADAAAQLLFPDFGRFVRYSALWSEDKVTVAPWDVVKLSGCQE